jgi:MoaA/NifB/PqqE/SkfB family radical SAM enzyme
MLTNYNSFNTLRILAHRPYLQKVVAWYNGVAGVELPPPLYLTIDPTNLCSVNCIWCKTKAFRNIEPKSMPNQLFLELPEMLATWGVFSIVLSGGEPLTHPKIVEFLWKCHDLNIKVGIKTSGVPLAKLDISDAVRRYASWVGISLDACTEATYSKIKHAGIQAFSQAVAGVQSLVQGREETESDSPEITLKFLIHHLNYGEMYSFANLAKTLGVDSVHFRPLYLEKYKYARGVRKTACYYLREARKDFEDNDFNIYGIVNKFDVEWNKIVRFKNCYAGGISGVLAVDGKFYICTEHRGSKNLNLGKYLPFPEFQKRWGSSEHRALLQKIMPQMCPCCGMSGYNETVEKCIEKDTMLLEAL